jgi:hypothetical protein
MGATAKIFAAIIVGITKAESTAMPVFVAKACLIASVQACVIDGRSLSLFVAKARSATARVPEPTSCIRTG